MRMTTLLEMVFFRSLPARSRAPAAPFPSPFLNAARMRPTLAAAMPTSTQ